MSDDQVREQLIDQLVADGHSRAEAEAITGRKGTTPRSVAEILSSSSSSDGQTPPPPLGGGRTVGRSVRPSVRRGEVGGGTGGGGPTDRQTEDRRQTVRSRGEGGGPTEEDEEEQAAARPSGGALPSPYPGMVLCPFCGAVESPHDCPKKSRLDQLVPTEFEELVRYLVDVWDIRLAELVALECGSMAVHWAVQIVRRGRANGAPYADPSGLVVKLARRFARASRRPR